MKQIKKQVKKIDKNFDPTKSWQEIPLKEHKHLKKKKWFEISDLTNIRPEAWLFIVKGRKGIGKSYAMRQLMLECLDTNDKFIYIRTKKDYLDSVRNMWDADVDWPYKIKGGKILLKSDPSVVKGLAGFANGLTTLKSNDFRDFKYVIYDEYVENNMSDYKGKNFGVHFITFLTDVIRDTKTNNNTKVFLFGNNNLEFDPITDYLKVPIIGNNGWLWNEVFGGFVINLRDYYEGALDDSNKARVLAYFNSDTNEFLVNNKTTVDLSNIVNYDSVRNSIILYYMMFTDRDIPYALAMDFKTKKYLCYQVPKSQIVKEIPAFSFTTGASLAYPKSIATTPETRAGMYSLLSGLLRTDGLNFVNTDHRFEFISLLTYIAPPEY